MSLSDVQLIDCDVEDPNCHLFLEAEPERAAFVTLDIPEIDKDKCTFCGKCARFCQYNALATLPEDLLFFPELCHGCGGCALVCPEGAITETQRPIGEIKHAETQHIDFWTGLLNIGEPMATPIIRVLKSKINHSATTILDSPPGTACPVIETLNGADYAILVTEPTPFGLHDLKLAVEVVRALDLPFGVIVNRQGVGDDRVQEYCGKSGIEILMEIPQSQDIARLYSKGIPFTIEMSEWKDRFEELFKKIREAVSG